MNQMLTYVISLIGQFIGFLATIELVPGIPVLYFLGACIVIGIVINQLIIRGGA